MTPFPQRLPSAILFAIAVACALAGNGFARPRWVTEMPNDPCFFFGRSQVERTGNLDEDRSNARSKALSDLAASIKSIVSSETRVFQEEIDGRVRNHYQEAIIARVESLKIEGHDVEEYKTKKKFFALARLSRKHYYAQVYAEWIHAKEEAARLFQTDESFSLPNRLANWLKALSLLSPYRGQAASYPVCGATRKMDNRVLVRGKHEFLDRQIAASLRDAVSGIEIQMQNQNYRFDGKNHPQPAILARARLNGEPVPGLAMTIRTKADGWNIQEAAITDAKGVARFRLEKAGIPGTHQAAATLAHGPALDDLKAYGLVLPAGDFSLHRPRPLVAFAFQEANQGNNSQTYVSTLKGIVLHASGIKESEADRAEFVITGTVNARKDGTQMGLCKARAFVDLTVLRKGKPVSKLVDSKTVGLVRYSFEQAGEKALRSAAKKQARRLLMEILRLD